MDGVDFATLHVFYRLKSRTCVLCEVTSHGLFILQEAEAEKTCRHIVSAVHTCHHENIFEDDRARKIIRDVVAKNYPSYADTLVSFDYMT